MTLKPGLYIIATPIGNLKDITLRALETLQQCDMIACEDTRVSRKLLDHYGIKKNLIAYHDHNAEKVRPILLQHIKEGKAVGLISDAGTPLISDPGAKLVKAACDENVYVTTLPGACSVISALVLSGLSSHAFAFCGFVEPKNFSKWKTFEGSLIFFESAKRLLKTLGQMNQAFENREACIIREISKLFEDVQKGDFQSLTTHFIDHPAKGEIVIVLGPPLPKEYNSLQIEELILETLQNHSLKDTAQIVAQQLNLSKKDIYDLALKLREPK